MKSFGKILRISKKILGQLFFRPYTVKKNLYGVKFLFLIDDLFAEEWYVPNTIKPEIKFLLSFIQEDDIIIDCGAHHGFLSVLLALYSPKGRVIAIEALPHNSTILVQNIALNRIRNTTIIPIAVGSEENTVLFSFYHKGLIYNSNGVPTTSARRGSIEVASSPLDNILNGVIPTILKIDVEGAELAVLSGAIKTLAGLPILDIEIHCSTFANRLQTIRGIFEYILITAYRLFVQFEIDGEICETIYSESLINKISRYDNVHLFAIPVARTV